jgi:hypothetical protein
MESPQMNGRREAWPPRSDEEVVERVRAEANGKFDRLWHGDLSDYGQDHSAADDGFVHKLWSYTQDEEQVRRIHAMSALHRPEKSGRRSDYLQRSINRARSNVTWFYEWPEQVSGRPHKNGRPDDRASFVSFVPRPVDWPVLADEAFYGLPGEITRCIKPHTEADPVAVLGNLLTAFGSAAGRGAFLRVGRTITTSSSTSGSWARPRRAGRARVGATPENSCTPQIASGWRSGCSTASRAARASSTP